MPPDCIAQSSKLSVCVCGVLVRTRGSAGSRAPEHPLCPPTPPPRGQGTPPLEIAAILGKEVAPGPGRGGGEWKGNSTSRGTHSSAAPRRNWRAGSRRAHRGAAPAATWGRLRSSSLVLPGVVRGNVPAPASFLGSRWVGRWEGGRLGTGGTRPPLETGDSAGDGGHLLSPVGTDSDSATHLAPRPPHPLPSLCLPAECQVSARQGAQGATPPGPEPPLTWLEGVSQEEP